MNWLRISTRTLYLLALFQLLAGPLVLVGVMTFCKLTVHELPQRGVGDAACHAWNSREFQSLLLPSQNDLADATDSSPVKPMPKVKKDGVKFSKIAWQSEPVIVAVAAKEVEWDVHARSWTPAWSQAPPGPPPRVA